MLLPRVPPLHLARRIRKLCCGYQTLWYPNIFDVEAGPFSAGSFLAPETLTTRSYTISSHLFVAQHITGLAVSYYYRSFVTCPFRPFIIVQSVPPFAAAHTSIVPCCPDDNVDDDDVDDDDADDDDLQLEYVTAIELSSWSNGGN